MKNFCNLTPIKLKQKNMKSLLHLLAEVLSESLLALKKDIPQNDLERIVLNVYTTMEGKNRKFHSAKHVLDLAQNLNSYQKIAVFFHDYVYWQVDKSLPEGEIYLPNYMRIVGIEGEILANAPQNENFNLLLAVFGFEKGQKINIFSGLNEFLSAFALLENLKNYFETTELIRLIANIEATIPFRKNSPFENLFHRLTAINQKFNLNITQENLILFVKEAVEVANQDVANFAHEDIAFFLDKTWDLLPETNNFITSVGVYSIKYYREILQKNYLFLSNLPPELVFHQFQQFPSDEKMAKKLENARLNLAIAVQYLQIKLVTQSILEAIAMQTGGDAPIAYFLGDARNYQEVVNIEHFLPKITMREDLFYDITVLKLVEVGRLNPSAYDLKNSPLAAFIYLFLGKNQVEMCFENAKKYFSNELSALDFLKTCDAKLLQILLHGIAQIAQYRTESLANLAQKLY